MTLLELQTWATIFPFVNIPLSANLPCAGYGGNYPTLRAGSGTRFDPGLRRPKPGAVIITISHCQVK